MKAIGTDILEDARISPRTLKAVALSLTVKSHLGGRTSIRHYTINKAAKIAHVSHTTAAKYMKVLFSLGLVKFEKDGTTLVFRRLSHSNKRRNTSLKYMMARSFKDAVRELQSLLIMVTQNRKNFIKRLIRSAKDPKSLQELKKARRFCDRHVGRNSDGSFPDYQDKGISFQHIAEIVGVCKRTAFRIVDYATGRGHLIKQKTPAYVKFMPGVNGYPVEGFTFTTKNNGYKVFANKYELPRKWEKELCVLPSWMGKNYPPHFSDAPVVCDIPCVPDNCPSGIQPILDTDTYTDVYAHIHTYTHPHTPTPVHTPTCTHTRTYGHDAMAI